MQLNLLNWITWQLELLSLITWRGKDGARYFPEPCANTSFTKDVFPWMNWSPNLSPRRGVNSAS
jgi:hypothetical protein